jgi:hypothetical protein
MLKLYVLVLLNNAITFSWPAYSYSYQNPFAACKAPSM